MPTCPRCRHTWTPRREQRRERDPDRVAYRRDWTRGRDHARRGVPMEPDASAAYRRGYERGQTRNSSGTRIPAERR